MQTEVVPPFLFKSGDCRTNSVQHRSWGRIDADLVRRTGLEREETNIAPRRHLILLNLRGKSERGEHFIDARPTSFIPRRPGAILFIPAGCSWKGWEGGDATAAYLSVSVDPAFVADLFDQTPSRLLPTLSPDLGCEDAVMMNAARGIVGEVSHRNPLSHLMVESYVATIFAQLARRQRYVYPALKGGLASANLGRVLQRIDDELDSSLTLKQLASLAGLSIPHFCRAFRQSTGMAPYAFVIHRRVERARELLRNSQMTITEVALACGFSSSSHLSNVFRREAGTTPRKYRYSWQVNKGEMP